MNKVFVSMPSGSEIPVQTARSLMEWQMYRKTPAKFSFKLDTYIEKARNEAVVSAVASNATHLMFIDSDMVFPPEGIDRLIEQKKDIIGGLYFGRIHPKPMAFRLNGAETISINPRIDKGTVEVDFIGTGFMLINMDVFKKLDPPFFRFTYNPTEVGLPETKSKFVPKGEDVFFCMYAKQHGFRVWCDTTIELGHIGNRVYTKRDYLKWKEEPDFYEK